MTLHDVGGYDVENMTSSVVLDICRPFFFFSMFVNEFCANKICVHRTSDLFQEKI